MCNCIDVLGGIVPPPNLPCIGRYCTLQPLKFHQLFRCLRFGKSLDDNDHDGNETTKMKVMMRTLERVKRCTAWKCNTGGDQPSINWDSLLRSRIAICWIRKPRYIKIAVQVIFQLELQETLGILKYNTIPLKASGSGNLARRHHDYGGR